jgi:hypothetical protein
MKMIKTKGVDIPRLGFGTFRMPGGASQPVVESAIELGLQRGRDDEPCKGRHDGACQRDGCDGNAGRIVMGIGVLTHQGPRLLKHFGAQKFWLDATVKFSFAKQGIFKIQISRTESAQVNVVQSN